MYSLDEIVAALDPDQGIPAPVETADEHLIAHFNRIIDSLPHAEQEVPVIDIPSPKWLFFRHVVQRRLALLHGSNNTDIDEFIPRMSNCASEEGNQEAIYASSDPLQPIFYAVVNRRIEHPFAVTGIIKPPDTMNPLTLYYFSTSILSQEAEYWTQGAVYLLPTSSFIEDSHGVQWRSATPVKPLAKVIVIKNDFPFADIIPRFNLDKYMTRMSENLTGCPWYDNPDLTPVNTKKSPD